MKSKACQLLLALLVFGNLYSHDNITFGWIIETNPTLRISKWQHREGFLLKIEF